MNICTLDRDINKCPFFENEICKNKNKCSYQVAHETNNSHRYVREERWYEKYYRNSRRK